MIDTTSQEFFDSKYRLDRDPWGFSTSAYEADRYAATIRSLEGRRYQRVVEPGCSIGVLTERLATLADRVDAFDLSPTAVDQARLRCSQLSNVHIATAALTLGSVQGSFDLLVLSEIGYYFSESEFPALAQSLANQLKRDGVLVAVHWLGYSPDHCLSGDRVHDLLFLVSGLLHEYGERHEEFRLDRWRRI